MFDSKEDLLNNLFEHVFEGVPDDEITDEDQEWFNTKVANWFDQFDPKPGPRRKRPGDSGGSGSNSRRRSSNTGNNASNDKNKGGAYGSGLFFKS